jgi:Rad3-related DNA helicase
MALSAALKACIQDGYRAFLAHRGLRPRAGQRRMIAEIAGFFAALEPDSPAPRVCAIEAGTGTGKTLAYLLAALPIAREQGRKLVIATGTVALQGQLVDRDIPDLLAATGWECDFALAKGRGRYLCPLRLEQCEAQLGEGAAGRFLFEDELAFAPARGDAQRLAALDPRRVLSRGYAWMADAQGRTVVSARAVGEGDRLQAVWADGSAQVQVRQVRLRLDDEPAGPA